MANEPEIPLTEGDGVVVPAEIAAKIDPEKGASNAGNDGEDDKSKQGGEGDSEKLKATDEQLKKITDGWKEDREFYQGEVKRLRAEASNPKLTAKEEEELEGLDEDERVDKKMEFRDKRNKAAEAAQLESVKREVRFYELSSTEFAENKKDILKVAQDYECPNLKQTILIWRGLNVDKAKKDANYHDQRKKDAGGKPGGNAGGKPAGKPYDAKTDGKKSFSELYAEV